MKTQAAAEAILTQLKGGASFATLAQQDSTDKTSGAQGGALGCLAPSEFVAPFQTAADKAPVGTPVGPVHSQFGYHVILVTKATSLDATPRRRRTQVLQALAQQQAQAPRRRTAINALLKSFNVHLDPRFGTWGLDAQRAGPERSLREIKLTPPKPLEAEHRAARRARSRPPPRFRLRPRPPVAPPGTATPTRSRSEVNCRGNSRAS